MCVTAVWKVAVMCITAVWKVAVMCVCCGQPL